MSPVTLVYFCYGWNLWLFLSWIPQYFLHSYNLDLKQSALFSSSVFFAGVLGDSLGGVMTDRLLRSTGTLKAARSWMVSGCMLLTLLVLIPLAFTHNLSVSLACLSAGFFFAEMTIGPMWAIPMDIAPAYSGNCQRYDELRLGARGDRQSGRFRLPHRPVPELGAAVRLRHAADGRGDWYSRFVCGQKACLPTARSARQALSTRFASERNDCKAQDESPGPWS